MFLSFFLSFFYGSEETELVFSQGENSMEVNQERNVGLVSSNKTEGFCLKLSSWMDSSSFSVLLLFSSVLS